MRLLSLRLLLGFLVITRFLGCSSGTSSADFTSTTTPIPPATLQRIQVTAGETTLAVGFTVQLTATGVYSDNSTRDLTSSVSWSSSTPLVASVTTGGLVSAIAPGNVSFTATLDGISGSTGLEVTDATLTGVEVRPLNATIAADTHLQYRAVATFDDASDLDVTSQAAWSSTTGSISAAGLLTAGAAGGGTVSATFSGLTGTTNVTVSGATLVSISITPRNPIVAPGGQVRLLARGTFSDGTVQDLPNVTWTSATTGTATIDGTGLLRGVAGETSVITARQGGVSGTTTASVAALVSIAVQPANAPIAGGAYLPYTAVGTFAGGATADLTTGVSWSSSNHSATTISTSGVALGVAGGSSSITAAMSGISGSTPLTVLPPPVLPTPVADDPTYFQILLDERVEEDEVVHYTYVAGTLSLTAPATLNTTWLTGGGPNNDDYTQPVMQIASTATGNANANFASTYDFVATDLPLDPTGRYRVLRIPFLDPTNNTQSNAGSGRLYITLNSPATMQVNAGGPGGFSIAQPSPVQNGAGSQNRFDFIELNCATPAVNGKNVCFVNTTNVDFFSLGITVQGRQANGTLASFGLDLSNSNPVASVLAALEALPGNFGTGKTLNANGTFTRFLAPDLSFPAGATDLDAAIASGYAYYATTPLSFQVNGVQYTATTVGNVLTFTAPVAFNIPLPTTLNVIAATGPLDVNGQTAQAQDGQKFVAAYLNRGVFENVGLWNNQQAFYPSGIQSNLYAALLHQRFLDGAVYGFSFDDVPSGNTLTAPTIGDCTSMTLVIDEE